MCGIVAANARRAVAEVLIEGLHKLEYRGYDSAGLALLEDGKLMRERSAGRVADLQARLSSYPHNSRIGIAHTRWATHGAPSERNAHPHISSGLAVVHNGIIENHNELRQRLKTLGYEFQSDTDTEVIAHLLAEEIKRHQDFLVAARQTVVQLKGAFAIAVLAEQFPDKIIVARHGAPLLIGQADDGYYAASDTSALLQVTRQIIYLEDGDIAMFEQNRLSIVDTDGVAVSRPVITSALSADAVELGTFRHYMQKEIFEQPQAIANTLEIISGGGYLQPEFFGANAGAVFSDINKVLIIACGTSFHAGLVARYWIEAKAQLPCSVEIASEYRYRTSVADSKTLVVVISQSGETADTLGALKHAKSLGMQHTLAICNVPESAIVRETSLRFITRAGPEIGVASTKAFSTQLASLAVLALCLAKIKNRLTDANELQYLNELRHLPVAIGKVLGLESSIQRWAQNFSGKDHALFLGRGSHWPIAMEGALKLKEISYIHAEAYAAGELKHGPLALVDANMPVISIAPNDELIEKLYSNLHEVRARGGELYVFADGDSNIQAGEGIHVIKMPEHYGLLSPILHVIPLQLLSYHAALVKGTDVDKPRNLAKSVTVE